MNEPDQAEQTALESAGAMLHAERRRQNMSVGDVSRHLKLSVRQVEALEHDEYGMFGGAVFVHGFLRNYAKLLGIDPRGLIAAADRKMAADSPVDEGAGEESPGVAVTSSDTEVQNSLVPLFVVAAIIVAAIAAWVLLRDRGGTDGGEMPGPVAEQLPAAVVEHEEVIALTEPGADVAPEAPVAEVTREVRSEVRREDPDVPKSTIVMVFRQESWVQISDRYGDILFAQLSPPGVSHRINGYPPLSIVIGNAVGVDLIYNDEPVDLEPHTRIDVARLTLE